MEEIVDAVSSGMGWRGGWRWRCRAGVVAGAGSAGRGGDGVWVRGVSHPDFAGVIEPVAAGNGFPAVGVTGLSRPSACAMGEARYVSVEDVNASSSSGVVGLGLELGA
jgi:hypothetical protein